MSTQKCIIVGASHAAAQVAPTLRQQGWEGSITILGDEYFLPYHRPPLSKDFLSGAKSIDNLFIRQPAIYEKSRIRFALGVTVSAINRADKQVVLDDGEHLSYDKLVLTVGARVRKIDIPGCELPGVYYLRNINDVQQIKRYTGHDKKAVIIGGGYIGLETAASLRKLGMDVTVLEAMPRVLQRVTAPEISRFYTRVHSEEGVKIVTDTQVEAIQGDKNAEAVVCKNGDIYPADLIIVGVGVIPNTELAANAGLKVDNGIVVDEYARTSDPDILAAGDCTSHFNPIYGRQMRLESVQNALDQGIVAANTICGKEKPYSALPWFWSDQYDLKLQIAGLSQGYTDVVIRGDIETGRSFAAFYLKDSKILAVDAVNSPQEFMLSKKLITDKADIDPTRLGDSSIPLKNLIP
ncbi:MAG: FAD-dependent oxidoreductase [Porticoccaceae bacterium]|nr:FAD-dependent oxidoreductase [Porticoccaceae bacterium]